MGDYGITWDESAQSHYGEIALDYFRSGGEDRAALEFLDLYLYGPLFESLAALLYSAAPESRYLVRHFLVALCGLLSALAVWRIGRLFSAPFAGVYAALTLLLLPRFYGHSFVNSKDIPFACAVAFAMLALLRFAESRGAPLRTVLCGLAFGVALALRPGGAPLLFLLFAASIAWAAIGSGHALRLALRSLAVWGVAWAAMVLFWPYALESPIAHPLEAMGAALSFPVVYEVLFDGVAMASDALPRRYYSQFLWLTTPPFALALAGLGLGLALLAALRSPRSKDRTQPAELASFLVPLWLGLPLASAAIARPNVYDGLRHMLFVLPAVALLSGLAAAELARRVADPRLRRLAHVALVLALLLPLPSLVRLHPYQMTYFNALAGGVAGASGRYETDYWVSSYREAALWLNARAAEREGDPLLVLAAVDFYSRECVEHYLSEDVVLTTIARVPDAALLPRPFDYYLGTTRYSLDERYPGSPLVHSIGRDGATFSVIRGRDAR